MKISSVDQFPMPIAQYSGSGEPSQSFRAMLGGTPRAESTPEPLNDGGSSTVADFTASDPTNLPDSDMERQGVSGSAAALASFASHVEDGSRSELAPSISFIRPAISAHGAPCDAEPVDTAKAFSACGLLVDTDPAACKSTELPAVDLQGEWTSASAAGLPPLALHVQPQGQEPVGVTLPPLLIRHGVSRLAAPSAPPVRLAPAPAFGNLALPARNVSGRYEDQQARALSDKVPTPPPTRTRTSVVLTRGDAGGVRVIAAAPGLDRESANRLRKLMSEVAAQFGVDISALQLNGVPIEKPVLGSTGGPHGH